MTKIVLAHHAGACYGVKRALSLVQTALQTSPAPVNTLGPLIHNPQVVEELTQAGVGVAQDLNQAQYGTLVIRSHGVRPEIIEHAKDNGLCVVDATCPHVSKAQEAAHELYSSGHQVIVVGELGHPEVEAICACAKDEALVVQSPADLPVNLDIHSKPIGVVVQTTQSPEALDAVLEELTARGVKADVRSTICFATLQRQEAALELARNADAMIVVGGRNSGNTRRLFEICQSVCPNTYHIELASEIDATWLAGMQIIGISAGASTPESQINAVVKHLERLTLPSVAIAKVKQGSVAYRSGIRAGMQLRTVDEHPIRDYIDWLWLSADASINLEIEELGIVELEREAGEHWGIEFDSPVFDGVHTCVNNCSFCFMSMLPKGLRPSLYLRDDDYRLSFLQGNFVTLTNVSDSDVKRIVEHRLSPLHVSLHAIDAAVRQELIGNQHARGIEVLEQLLECNIEVHAQIVLVPGVNDGAVLARTLDWVAARSQITTCGIVPYGYTRYASLQKGFDTAGCKVVIEQVADWQKVHPNVSVQLADEFFVKAWPDSTVKHLPPSNYYGSYPMLYDGIGMLRSFVNEWSENLASAKSVHCGSSSSILIATGAAFASILAELICSANITGIDVLAIRNNFFGGNVDVAGLLTAADITEQVLAYFRRNSTTASSSAPTLFIPSNIFNDDGLTLDDKSFENIKQELEPTVKSVVVVDCQPSHLLAAIRQ